jgi:hypothetical protein
VLVLWKCIVGTSIADMAGDGREKRRWGGGRGRRKIYPEPSARVRVTLHKDVLAGGPGSTNAVDGSLVKLRNERVGHVMVLVVGVEDDLAVAREPGGNVLPVSLETARVGDDLAVVAPKVLRVDDGVCAFACDVVDDLGDMFS